MNPRPRLGSEMAPARNKEKPRLDMLEAGCGRYLEKMQFPIGVYNSSFRPPKHEIESFARCIFPAIQAGRFGHHSIDVAMLGLDKKLGRADYKSDHVIHPVGYF